MLVPPTMLMLALALELALFQPVLPSMPVPPMLLL